MRPAFSWRRNTVSAISPGIGGMAAHFRKRGLKMRDELDARAWTAHHDRFSADLRSAVRGLARRLGQVELRRAPAAHLASALIASGLTLTTFAFTIV